MDDKELVEVWRKEFLSLIDKNKDIPKSHRNNYWTNIIDDRWQGFLMAKRSQPSVVMPEGNSDGMVYAGEVNERLTAAGIKYTIGE